MGAKATLQKNTATLRSELIIFQSLDANNVAHTKNRKILETYLQPELPVSVDDCQIVFAPSPDKKHYLAFAILKTDLEREINTLQAQNGDSPEILIPEQYLTYASYLSLPTAKQNAVILSTKRENWTLLFIQNGNLNASYTIAKDDLPALLRTIKLTQAQTHINPEELLVDGNFQIPQDRFPFPIRNTSLPQIAISPKLNLRYGDFTHHKVLARQKRTLLISSILLLIISALTATYTITQYLHQKRLYEIADSTLKSQAELVANAQFNSTGIIAAMRAKGMTEWQNEGLIALSTPDFSAELKDALEFASLRKITFSQITATQKEITFIGKAPSKSDLESWQIIATSKGAIFTYETTPSGSATSFKVIIMREDKK